MSERDTMFNERDQRCTAVQPTDPSYDNQTIASTLKMKIWIATNNRDVPRVMKRKFPAMVMVFGVVRATSCHLTSSKSACKSTPKCICATTLYPSLSGPPPPPSTRTRWTTSFGHTSKTSPT